MKVMEGMLHWNHNDGYVSVQNPILDDRGKYKKLLVCYCHKDGEVWDMEVIEGDAKCLAYLYTLKPAKFGVIFDTLRQIVDDIRDDKHNDIPYVLKNEIIKKIQDL